MLGLRRNIIGREGGAFTEKVFLHLLANDLLRLAVYQIERYSLTIIFRCSTHIFQASAETFS